MAQKSIEILDSVEAIEDAMYSIPREQRLEVLAEVTKRVTAYLARPPFKAYTAAELFAMGVRSQKGVEIVKSRIIQRLVRDITNENHPRDAARILFMQHRDGTGSGCTLDYIGDLIPRRQRQRA